MTAQIQPEATHRRIVLTGFMGSGKTTVGPLVASLLGWRFVDVDDVIEAEAGVPITEIFARQGEEVFRESEHQTIARLAESNHLVLALGGGAIEHPKTRSLLLTTPRTLLVHLEVELATRWPAAAERKTRAPSWPTKPTSKTVTPAAFRSTAARTSPSLWTGSRPSRLLKRS